MMHVLFLLGLQLLAASLAGANLEAANGSTIFNLPFQPIDGPSAAEVLSVDGGLDLPKLTPGVNASTFDWWYFDAVSTTTIESVAIAFFNFGKTTLEVPDLGGSLVVQVSGTFFNGTNFFKSVAATRNASVVADGSGIASHWDGEGGGYSFNGSSLDGPNITYTVSMDDPDSGIFGTLELRSVSPPRYPCDLDIPGTTEEIIPSIYWANAVPDSDATVGLIIGGEHLRFHGVGYHDKKWGVKPLNQTLDTWYWGHGRFGPYSLVWFDALAKDGKEYFSAWATKNGTTIFRSCEDRSVVVRPWGKDCAYPPKPKQPAPSGYDIRYEWSGPAFSARFFTSTIPLSTDTYKRIMGPIIGGFEGKEQYEGTALCEQVQN